MTEQNNNSPCAEPTVTVSAPPLLMRGEDINVNLREHQRQATDWDCKATVADLHVWVERMIFQFKLQIGIPALMIAKLRGRRLGHFCYRRNGFGLNDEIAIDSEHLNDPWWTVLGTLFHELLHSWQHVHGEESGTNYHNREFRKKAAAFGLIVDQRGCTQYQPGDTPFMVFLKQFDVTPPELPEPVIALAREGNSKLHLYECPCGVKARIGRSEFHAKCLDCGGNFELKR